MAPTPAPEARPPDDQPEWTSSRTPTAHRTELHPDDASEFGLRMVVEGLHLQSFVEVELDRNDTALDAEGDN